jgi:hypothetical protein
MCGSWNSEAVCSAFSSVLRDEQGRHWIESCSRRRSFGIRGAHFLQSVWVILQTSVSFAHGLVETLRAPCNVCGFAHTFWSALATDRKFLSCAKG